MYLTKNQAESTDINQFMVFPCVIKPLNQSGGKGVTVNIRTKEEFIRGLQTAFSYESKIIVQEMVAGDDYRIFIVGDEIVAGLRREPPFVFGDGVSSLEQCIKKENETNSLRGTGYNKVMLPIKIDYEVNQCLAAQGLSLQSILPRGEKVFVRRNANISTGGVPIDVTDELHEDIKKIALQAAKTVGLVVGGIDILTTDCCKPLAVTGGCIIEVNATPSIDIHHIPAQGKGRNVARKIIEQREKSKI